MASRPTTRAYLQGDAIRVFVTGHKGYIGVHLVQQLQEGGHTVTGCDLDLFSNCNWSELPKADKELRKDVRALTPDDLAGHDCIMQLAALSNDPLGKLDEQVTFGVNKEGTTHVARVAKQAGVPRFLFAASCAEYGHGQGDAPLDETAPFDPLSVYAQSKIEAEAAILELSDDSFCVSILRNATAFGASPMLRLDLVANNLLASAYALGEIRVMSDGTPWRPIIHCRDIARAFVAFAEAPADAIRNRSVNIGGNAENYQIKDIALAVQRLVPGAPIVFTGEIGPDARSYRVNFDLLGKLLPQFKLHYSLQTGLEELHRQFVEHGFTAKDFLGDRYFRLRAIKHNFHLLQE